MKKKLLKKMKRKVNNAGMTLIEILVAMALLVVAIIPLSAGYIYSAKHSAKAKHMQQTSVLAHTMIENCKAYSFDEIDKMVTVTKNFMPNTEADKHFKDPSVVDGAQYYFDDVVVYTDESGNASTQIYDLSMRITPILSMNKEIMLYSDMNEYSDAFLLPSTLSTTGQRFDEAEGIAYDYLLDQIAVKINADAATHSGQTLINADRGSIDTSLKTGTNSGLVTLERRINITAYIPSDEKVIATCSYTYSYAGSGKYSYQMRDAHGNINNYQVTISSIIYGPVSTYNIYSNSTSGANAGVENIYIFYYPSYNNVNLDFADDEFNIVNGLGRNVNVYIMKQRRTEMSSTEINVAESSYNLTIDGTTDAGTKIKLFHNLREKLEGTGVAAWTPPAISPYIEFQDFDNDPDDYSTVESLVDDMSKQLMYKVEVAIYSSNGYQTGPGGSMSMSGDALCTMEGTFLDW